jgi:hypothetical protein
MSPVSGKTDPTGAVYVLDRYVKGRPILAKPTTNAERPDTDRFYADGVYDAYPALKSEYEARRRSEARKTEQVRVWARAALVAADAGTLVPPTKRTFLLEVLRLLYRAGESGLTRPEICNILDQDGGKISGVMTDLHGAGIIFPLEGVRR